MEFRYGTITGKYVVYRGKTAQLRSVEGNVSENDVANGRVASMQDTFDDIRKSLLERKSNEV